MWVRCPLTCPNFIVFGFSSYFPCDYGTSLVLTIFIMTEHIFIFKYKKTVVSLSISCLTVCLQIIAIKVWKSRSAQRTSTIGLWASTTNNHKVFCLIFIIISQSLENNSSNPQVFFSTSLRCWPRLARTRHLNKIRFSPAPLFQIIKSFLSNWFFAVRCDDNLSRIHYLKDRSRGSSG